MRTPSRFTSVVAGLTVAACASYDPPSNLEPVAGGGGYQAQYRAIETTVSGSSFLRSAEMNAEKCLPLRGGVAGKGGGLAQAALRGERLSRNDLVDIRVGEDETFSGAYVVSRDGQLKLPFLDPIRAEGRRTEEIEADLQQMLLAEEFYAEAPRISVRVADFASVYVSVSGAVFEPRALEVGSVSGDKLDARRQDALGASTEGRNLSAALRLAGGVRPDADISAVTLRRGGQVFTLDMRGVFEGRNVVDVMLITGDEINVPSRNCFQDHLMRPSPISPPGVSLFLSNLTRPAAGNAVSAIGRDVREMPYGSRYLQAVVDANCVGGTRTTSANRSSVLISRNPKTGVSTVIERNIEDLLRRADRDDYDPYLLPGDALACYDSTFTNVTDVINALTGLGD